MSSNHENNIIVLPNNLDTDTDCQEYESEVVNHNNIKTIDILLNNNLELPLNLLNDNKPVERTLFNRYFSKLGPGSMRASILNLSIVSLGIGCLALPKVFGDISILYSVIILILGGFVNNWTLNMLIHAGKKKKLTVYSHVCKEYLGNGAAIFYDVIMIILVFGSIITYEIICKV